MKRIDILALGEAMVEFNQTGAGDGRLFLQGFGGAGRGAAGATVRTAMRIMLLLPNSRASV